MVVKKKNDFFSNQQMQPILPYEILAEIAFKHPMAFKLMYQTCKRMSQMNVLQMMDESTVKITNKYNDILYILPNGNKHRGYDLPAIIDHNGHQIWYKNGQLHRDDGPAFIDYDGRQKWYKNGQEHRDDGPAVIYPDGFQAWYKNGQIHKDDGPAIIYPNGFQVWYKNGQIHRDDGTAMIYDSGRQEWYIKDVKADK